MHSGPKLNSERLRSIILSDDFITSDKFLLGSGEEYNYFKRDFLFKSGTWRGHQARSVWRNFENCYQRRLVVGHSDRETSWKHLKILSSIRIKKIFGTNTINKPGFSESIPLGLTNDCDDSPIHRILGDTNHFRKAEQISNAPTEFDKSIYLNFNLRNNLTKRTELMLALKDSSNIETDDIDVSDAGRTRYLTKLRKASLVPCPEGNGIDTHRLWETMYMGGTPVILRNKFLPTVLDNLPVIQLDSWSHLNDVPRMEALWYQVNERQYEFESLTATYWIERMKSA